MSRYGRAKENLTEQVRAQLEIDARANREPDTPRVRQSLIDEATGIVDEFELLAANQSFWRGVKQSFVGSLAFALVPGVFYLIYLGFHLDLWSKLFMK